MNAYDARAELDLQAKIWVRLARDTQVATAYNVFECSTRPASASRTTIGRITFNNVLPRGLPVPQLRDEQEGDQPSRGGRVQPLRAFPGCRQFSTASRDAGFHYATRAGVTVSVYDATVRPNKAEILAKADAKVRRHRRGLRDGSYEPRTSAISRSSTSGTPPTKKLAMLWPRTSTSSTPST